MGIWDFINSTADTVKRNAPDLTSVRNSCRSSYDYGWTAGTKINDAVRFNAVERLSQHLPDGEGRAKIGRFTTNFVKNAAVYACHEGLKSVPGGVSVYNIVSRTLREEKTEDDKEVIKSLQARIARLERESSGCRKLLDSAEMLSCDVEFDSRIASRVDSNANQDAEDVLRIFMMKEFGGRHILDDLMVPEVRNGKNRKQNLSISHQG